MKIFFNGVVSIKLETISNEHGNAKQERKSHTFCIDIEV